jgi:hypothetical protein
VVGVDKKEEEELCWPSTIPALVLNDVSGEPLLPNFAIEETSETALGVSVLLVEW